MRIGIYPGQYYDAETGLHYNYHRYYDPGTGRYLRPDPSLSPDCISRPPTELNRPEGLHPFVYAVNSPTNRIDPNGLVDIPPELIGRIPPELIEKIIASVTGGAAAVICANRYCKQKRIPPDKVETTGRCMAIFAETKWPTGPAYSPSLYISECAAECYNIARSAKFKEACCNK